MSSSDNSEIPFWPKRASKRRSSSSRPPFSATLHSDPNTNPTGISSKKRKVTSFPNLPTGNNPGTSGSTIPNIDATTNQSEQPSTSAVKNSLTSSNHSRVLVQTLIPKPFNASGLQHYRVRFSRSALLRRKSLRTNLPEFKGGEKKDINRLPDRHGMYAPKHY